MWLSQRRQTELEETTAELGQVTVPGAPAGVALAGERRDVALCLPGGYHWTPKRGDTVLVVKGGAEGAPCIVGTPAGQKVPAGEVFLSVKNGVGIRLTADGRICLMGPVEIAGSLSVNFLLTARRGKFPLLPEVGSRLYQIFREKPSARGALGASYAAEALAGERDLRVLGAVWEEESQTLTVSVAWEDERLDVTLDASDLVVGT